MKCMPVFVALWIGSVPHPLYGQTSFLDFSHHGTATRAVATLPDVAASSPAFSTNYFFPDSHAPVPFPTARVTAPSRLPALIAYR